jgi:hypothetical protein
MLIYGIDDGELVARALSIESEVGKKLDGGWRAKPWIHCLTRSHQRNGSRPPRR